MRQQLVPTVSVQIVSTVLVQTVPTVLVQTLSVPLVPVQNVRKYQHVRTEPWQRIGCSAVLRRMYVGTAYVLQRT